MGKQWQSSLEAGRMMSWATYPDPSWHCDFLLWAGGVMMQKLGSFLDLELRMS